ncbi:hypothetical protein Tsubulata_037477 [Turnera subulata]|uniref:Uncharacterized protein n=1 Tax=Turnera subulata TaxID=218843 RepID=A0A9Q0FHF8_9ROSI|nr:hypothetical protein Tsubulata_037477 [Turnera subulata]
MVSNHPAIPFLSSAQPGLPEMRVRAHNTTYYIRGDIQSMPKLNWCCQLSWKFSKHNKIFLKL